MNIKGIFVSNQHFKSVKSPIDAIVLALVDFVLKNSKKIDIEKLSDYLKINKDQFKEILYGLYKANLVSLDEETIKEITERMTIRITMEEIDNFNFFNLPKFKRILLFKNGQKPFSFTLNEIFGFARGIKYRKYGDGELTKIERYQLIQATKNALLELRENFENPRVVIEGKIEELIDRWNQQKT